MIYVFLNYLKIFNTSFSGLAHGLICKFLQ